MKYEIIFAFGYTDDSEAIMKGYKSDVLLLTPSGDYYELNFMKPGVIDSVFNKNDICFLESNLVVLHEVTKENILKSIPVLHKWKFFDRWMPLPLELVEKYYYPKEEWSICTVEA